MSAQKINANTKRVSLSLTYEEIHLLDDALFSHGCSERFGVVELKQKPKDRAAKKKAEAEFNKFRARILPICNRWYDFRRAKRDREYRETYMRKYKEFRRAKETPR